MTAPGPSREQLLVLLRAALRVPDFLNLRPYRFLVAQDQGLVRLGEAMQRAALASGRPASDVERAKRMPLRAPLIVIVISSPKTSDVVSLFDQHLCAACAAHAIELAATAMGFAGIWRTGWPATDANLAKELGLRPAESIVAFLYLGTSAGPAPRALADEAVDGLMTPL